MGKRSDFERVERDFYPTPEKAVLPLLPHLSKSQKFIEPCAGDGQLVGILDNHEHVCLAAFDIEPKTSFVKIHAEDATIYRKSNKFAGHRNVVFITNPPWNRKILHPIIKNLSAQAPTWLLFDADWMHTKQAIPYLKWCAKIVSVGRIKWIPDSKMTGKDNCAWYLFNQKKSAHPTMFYGPKL